LSLENVLIAAKRARAQGATRFCMGAAWRGVRDGSDKFERVLEIVREVSRFGMEVCVTLGEIGPMEARKLKAAGVTAYNHNIDTSPEFYPEIVSTHTFQDRVNTIAAVQESGMSVCCGGIIGMGESEADRLRMLEVLSNFDPPPDSVPINCLMAMPGTPLADQPPVDIFELVRLIAVTRIALPKARVRLAAGRTRISREGQALCFFAGANSIFFGDKLLTARNPEVDLDLSLLRELGLKVENEASEPRPVATAL
jgi:biotin synthase